MLPAYPISVLEYSKLTYIFVGVVKAVPTRVKLNESFYCYNKTEQDLEKLRISGRLAAQVLEMIGAYIKPGVSTEYLDNLCNDYIVNTLKVIPANVGYHGFTKTICTSVNEVVCHGIPSPNKILKRWRYY